jgi:hypothetical protein
LVAESLPWQRRRTAAQLHACGVVDRPFSGDGFYLKQVWEVAARIDCEPPGHTRFYMTKKLS